MSKEMANKLKTFRTSSGFTQQAIASKINVDRSTYSNYERGVTEPDIKTIIKLADVFNVTTDELLGRGDEAENVAEPGGLPVFTLSKTEHEFLISLRLMDKEERSTTKGVMDEILNKGKK